MKMLTQQSFGPATSSTSHYPQQFGEDPQQQPVLLELQHDQLQNADAFHLIQALTLELQKETARAEKSAARHQELLLQLEQAQEDLTNLRAQQELKFLQAKAALQVIPTGLTPSSGHSGRLAEMGEGVLNGASTATGGAAMLGMSTRRGGGKGKEKKESNCDVILEEDERE
ncbi:unnamed protein product [Amoebophrya sp. A25]|nr:unnamed protein product [Amoebophrya sp. A25]|eukprot:GSA25T00004868001.1